MSRQAMSMDASAPYILFDNVEVRYSELVFGLRGLSLSIAQGEFVFFVGPTGAGKSTVLKLLTREVRHTAGCVRFNNQDLGSVSEWDIPLLRRQMGIVPQDFALLPRKRVWENVGYAMRAIGKSRREVRHKVPSILESVNIGHRADAFPSQLSGGEQQRVAIARALINDPLLIVADEPTGNLDPAHSMEIMDILRRLNDRGVTVLVASHDMAVVDRMQKRVVTLEDGLVVSDSKNPPASGEREHSEVVEDMGSPREVPDADLIDAITSGSAIDPEEAILARLPEPDLAQEDSNA
jgi:cell division transport system ATP-binding protein